jgi:site-specific DNA-cytosine methylase
MQQYVDNPFNSPSILSLCPGVLGLERGLERAIGPVRVAAYVEIEAFIIANLVAQMEQGKLAAAPIWSDVKTLNARLFRNKVHGIIGGYPCTPFSVIGKQTGGGHESHLWPYIHGHIGVIQPIFCWFENVVNHINIGYQQVKSELEAYGYTVKEGIYSALEAGATHTRERLFILAVDHSRCKGLQGYSWDDSAEKGWKEPGRSISKASVFPRERGLSQFEWEQPRTLNTKSGMGCTIDGYNYREDLLRAYGNSVVEQVAEIAFRDLLRKHFGSN